jgi:hypothetical protein
MLDRLISASSHIAAQQIEISVHLSLCIIEHSPAIMDDKRIY